MIKMFSVREWKMQKDLEAKITSWFYILIQVGQ